MNKSNQGFVDNIEEVTLANNNFREVLYTAKNSQLVVMSLEPGEDIGVEVHSENDQFLRIESGSGKVILNEEETNFENEFAIVIPAGTKHNVINTSDSAMKLYTIYSPPHHPEGTIHKTKAEAIAAEESE